MKCYIVLGNDSVLQCERLSSPSVKELWMVSAQCFTKHTLTPEGTSDFLII